jgi:hypothetical protein
MYEGCAYVGAFLGTTVQQMRDFNTATGTSHSLLHAFYDFPVTDDSAMSAFMQACVEAGAVPLITLQPRQVSERIA